MEAGTETEANDDDAAATGNSSGNGDNSTTTADSSKSFKQRQTVFFQTAVTGAQTAVTDAISATVDGVRGTKKERRQIAKLRPQRERQAMGRWTRRHLERKGVCFYFWLCGYSKELQKARRIIANHEEEEKDKQPQYTLRANRGVS